MPPSGYSPPAVNGLVQFVTSNIRDLQQEVVDGKHASVGAALSHELAQIKSALADHTTNVSPAAAFKLRGTIETLRLTQRVYEDLLEEVTTGNHSSLLAAAEAYAPKLQHELERVHIDEAGHLTER